MNGSRKQFLSGAGLAINQDRRVRWRHSFQMFENSAQRRTISNYLSEIHFRADFIFEIQFLFRELVFQLSNLPKGKCILHGNGNLVSDLGQKLDITTERIFLIFDRSECAQHATSAKKRKDADRSNFGLLAVLHSQSPRLLDAAAPKFAGAKDLARYIVVNGDQAFLLDGFVFERKIQSIDSQAGVVAIGKSNPDAIAAHDPARARHHSTQKFSELEIGDHMIGQFEEQSKSVVLFEQLLL